MQIASSELALLVWGDDTLSLTGPKDRKANKGKESLEGVIFGSKRLSKMVTN